MWTPIAIGIFSISGGGTSVFVSNRVGAQAAVPWLIIALTQVAVYGGLALAGDRARLWFADRPPVNLWLARGVGALLLATAAYTAYEGWRLG
jgi:threonine/homoserine/homoserine lactone efflux protein